MPSAKDIRVEPISRERANRAVKQLHYSGSYVRNSQLHLGVFLDGRLEGVMQFGPPFDKRKVLQLVANTPWNGMLELNRLAFSDRLPRNSESRALGIAMRLIRKRYPHVQWVLSFADGTQCGDGTIYRAAGFALTSVRKNTAIVRLADGSVRAKMTFTKGKHIMATGGAATAPEGTTTLPGFQLRYVYFVHPDARHRLTVPVLPFSAIAEAGAGMYRGRAREHHGEPGHHPGAGGETPTHALHA
jgi:hypothetical protein